MLFDTIPSNEYIVIVPPKPDAFASYAECSYSNLYNYNVTCDGGGVAAATTSSTTSASSSSFSTTISERSSTVSFDSSAFEKQLSLNNTQQQQHQPSLRESNNTGNITRDPRNGAFTFQVHAEYDLLLHIQKDLDRHGRSRLSNNSNIQLSKLVMRSIDNYCLQKQWMYHIGSEKGVAIGRFLDDCLKKRSGVENFKKKFICVELGTYCGYSALVLATTLCQFIQDQKQQNDGAAPLEFHIYTTEVSTKLINVAQSVLRLAKMEGHITPIFMKDEDSLSQTLQENGVTDIDFLLMDHDKPRYLRDLQELESSKMLREGSYVAADNVVFNRLDSYRNHMHELGLKGVVESRLEEMNLEYSNNLKDGIEMTRYLMNP